MSACVCMYVCMYVRMYVSIRAYMYLHVCMYAWFQASSMSIAHAFATIMPHRGIGGLLCVQSTPPLKPHETTMKPLMKPLDFYHPFHETGEFYRYYIYLLETFFSVEEWFHKVVDKIRVVSSLVSWWFHVVSCIFLEIYHNRQNYAVLSEILSLFSKHGKVRKSQKMEAQGMTARLYVCSPPTDPSNKSIHTCIYVLRSHCWDRPFCVYVRMYVYVCAYVHVCVYEFGYVCMYVRTCIRDCMYACMHEQIRTYTFLLR